VCSYFILLITHISLPRAKLLYGLLALSGAGVKEYTASVKGTISQDSGLSLLASNWGEAGAESFLIFKG
jgi:hypothetical protein